MSENAKQLEQLLGRGYQHGFVTEIDSDTIAPGLNEEVVRLISEIGRASCRERVLYRV